MLFTTPFPSLESRQRVLLEPSGSNVQVVQIDILLYDGLHDRHIKKHMCFRLVIQTEHFCITILHFLHTMSKTFFLLGHEKDCQNWRSFYEDVTCIQK